MNLDIQLELYRLGEVGFHFLVTFGIVFCFSMFSFCFHVQFAAKQS